MALADLILPAQVPQLPPAQANFEEIMRRWQDLRAIETRLAAAELAAANPWTPFLRATGQSPPGAAAGTYHISPSGFFIAAAGANTALSMFWFDPSDYAIAGKTLKLRLRLLIGVNAVAPGVVNYTLNMNTIPGFTGAAGVGPGITPGVAPAGAGVVVASPGALAASLATSADFNAPAASQYCLTIVVSALMAANSIVTCVGELAYRNV